MELETTRKSHTAFTASLKIDSKIVLRTYRVLPAEDGKYCCDRYIVAEGLCGPEGFLADTPIEAERMALDDLRAKGWVFDYLS